MTDRYTRTVLTVIAIALVVIAFRDVVETPAYAATDIECRVEGPIEVKSFNDDLTVKISDQIKVEVEQAFSAPGTSSSSPLHIKAAD